MQYILDEKEYKEYMKLKAANTETSILSDTIKLEGEVEVMINKAIEELPLAIDKQDHFASYMWSVLEKAKRKRI